MYVCRLLGIRPRMQPGVKTGKKNLGWPFLVCLFHLFIPHFLFSEVVCIFSLPWTNLTLYSVFLTCVAVMCITSKYNYKSVWLVDWVCARMITLCVDNN